MVLYATAPWANAQEQFNNFARIDRSLAAKLQELGEDQSHDRKLAWALESGRIYGLRQQKCQMLLKRELNKDYAHAPTEAMW
jgi:hypothetical protein